MPVICGVDGCKAGWIAIFKDLVSQTVSCQFFPIFSQLATRTPAAEVIAVDIPIGLPDRGSRRCDLEARRMLGRRGSSVFPAPIRPVLAANSYNEACQIRFNIEGKKMSRQAWGIVPKIQQVDNLLVRSPQLVSRIREVHPEVSFFFMNGRTILTNGKKSQAGQTQRFNLLQPSFGVFMNTVLLQTQTPPGCGKDDILDALAALWTAERIIYGKASRMPVQTQYDSFGLAMEIVA